ncbi:MAG: polysaccharide deacetylase family protein [Gemmatimonadales bacterium]|nr:polysaccharide deacetylase family protein [Gemmatimonadales bacterium]NIN50962.1 polysaccharide deacetylase family protein [Gemmatimonadales bacterium]NIP08426.1 polysaccharide deacetylase family protein [Gemmatimonadales bacterium]NIS63586.1 polysaccharide deacetylase family protein [Gemmatimonadales bacterium]
MCVSPSHFAQHLAVIRERANPIRLSELVRGLEEDRIPPRAVVVTFDDGYADNLYRAKPLLEQTAVPATVFVITGRIGGELWWDELARIVATASAPNLSIELPGTGFRWGSGGSAGSDPRTELLQALQRALQSLGDDARADALAQIRDSLADGTPGRVTHRCLDADELSALAGGDLIEVGAHSHTHPDLASLTGEDQRREVERSKAALEQLVDRPVQGFSYPHGSFNDASRRIVRECGFASACGSTPDLSRRRSDLFALPRLFVSDIDGATFAKWLGWWLGD